MSALFLFTTDIHYFEIADEPQNLSIAANETLLSNSPTPPTLTQNFIENFGITPTITEIIKFPSYDEIKQNIIKPHVAFLDCKPPPDDFLDVLVYKELPMLHENLSTQELRYNVDIVESLKNKLQLEVIETTNNFSNLAGAEQMKEFFKKVLSAYDEDPKLVEKITVFLLGIPGAGKTYLAECIAGEFNYLLVKLDLSIIMAMPNPFYRLHYFFKYVEKLAQKGVYVVALLDEIAQMLTGNNPIQTQFKGQLLTILEDLNTPRGYQIKKSIFIATENNIRDIMNNTPQFMARWVENFFIHFPKEEDAKSQIKMYLKKFQVLLTQEEINNNSPNPLLVERIYRIIEAKYRGGGKVEYDLEKNRFIYAPREIKKFCQKLKIYSKGVAEIDNNLLNKVAEQTPPQQFMLQNAISKMINDAGKGFITI